LLGLSTDITGDVPEVWRALPDGRRQPLLANAAAVTDASGNVVEVVHSLRDVTRLKQADEAKTMFLATASHELKTPLTVISGFAELLLSMPDLPELNRIEALEAIRKRTRELAAIVDRLLLSSRIESGRINVNIGPTDVEPLLRERVQSLEASSGRVVDLDLDGRPPAVLADPNAFTTVVDHLLENAITYSPGAEPIAVRVRAADERLEVSIIDRGIGMDAEQMARCFERFWQAESTDVRRYGGTGIGLYIVRSMVEAMGATIQVDSQPGRGTTFALCFRIVPESGTTEAGPRGSGNASDEVDIAAGGHK
jgi:signal transduction histidine kinase